MRKPINKKIKSLTDLICFVLIIFLTHLIGIGRTTQNYSRVFHKKYQILVFYYVNAELFHICIYVNLKT